MRDIANAPYRSKLQPTHFDLRNIYLPSEFVRDKGLKSKVKYPILIDGLESPETRGTLQDTNSIGGMAKMYKSFDLKAGDEIGLDFEDGTLIVIPPADRLIPRQQDIGAAPAAPVEGASAVQQQAQTDATPAQTAPTPTSPTTVFERQKLKYLHIPEFAPGNLTGWSPEAETDVFLVFGMLSENTDYRYCCGTSKELLTRLNYNLISKTKPDAVLIDRATGEYLMAEFKVYSADFTSNHAKEDVDVLVCWIDDAPDKSKLPDRVLALKDLREKGVKTGEITLDDLS